MDEQKIIVYNGLSKKRNDMKNKIFEVAKNHTENEDTAMQLTNELCVLLRVIMSDTWRSCRTDFDKENLTMVGEEFMEYKDEGVWAALQYMAEKLEIDFK